MLPTPTSIVAYLALFAAVGFLFLLVSLLLGRLLRAAAPSAEKLEPYECGEPSIGSSFVQFDLRFYVVALVFIIFEVEVALFFPPATVFGKATQLMDRHGQRSGTGPAEAISALRNSVAWEKSGRLGPNVPAEAEAEWQRRRPHAGPGRPVGPGHLLRRDPGGLRLRLVARRSRLGPGNRHMTFPR